MLFFILHDSVSRSALSSIRSFSCSSLLSRLNRWSEFCAFFNNTETNTCKSKTLVVPRAPFTSKEVGTICSRASYLTGNRVNLFLHFCRCRFSQQCTRFPFERHGYVHEKTFDSGDVLASRYGYDAAVFYRRRRVGAHVKNTRVRARAIPLPTTA